MKTLNSLLIPAASVLLLFSSCNSRSPYSGDTISFATMTEAHTYSLVGSAEDFGTDNDLIFVDSVSLLMPTLSGRADLSALQDSILKEAFDSTGVDQQAVITAYFDKVNHETGFETAKHSQSVAAYQADGYEIVKGSVINLSPQIMVYCVTNESMQPHAAHGTNVRSYINYLVAENRVITLSDLFTPEGLEQLPAHIAQRARDEVAVFGPTDITDLPSNNNFYLSADGEIVFAYQPYEVASFAQGAINVGFMPYELVTFMTPDAIRLFSLSDFTN